MLLLHVFPTFAVGGAQARFCAIANHFGPAFRHAVIALDGQRGAAERLDPGLEVSFPAPPWRHGDTRGNRARVRRTLRELRPDVMVTGNWGAIEWAMGNIPRLVRHIHIEDGFGPEERDRQIPRRVLTRRLVLRRSMVVLPSRTLLRIATEVWRLPPARLRYVPNGIDLSRFAAAAVPRAAGEAPVVGIVAALRPEKNIARLLRAFAAATADRPARLVVAGEGPERAALEALAARLGIAARTRFAGHVADPAPLYRDFDVFALSSDTEQMPLTVLEAMAAGLPVAATDVGDIATMVAAPNRALIVPPDDAALAGSLRRLLEDAGLRASLGAANRARAAAEFDAQRMFRSYDALYRGLPVSPAGVDG
jgi:glycosyltransferase involved in cell wall biosynthesis